MGQMIDVPGHGQVEFPDGMTDAQIVAAIKKNSPTPSRMATFGNAMVKGAAGFADAIPNAAVGLTNLGIAGYGLAKGALTGDAGSSPEPLDPNMLNGWRKAADTAGLVRPSAEPTDLPGRLIDFTGQAAGGGGLNPVSIGRNLARGSLLPVARDVVATTASGVGAGVGNEVGSNISTGNETADRALQAGLTFAGGAAPGAIISSRGTAGDRASAAVSGVTKEQMALADALAKKADRMGSPVTGYEAIQRVTGMNPKMQTQQRVTEQSDAGADTLTPMMQARPSNNAKLFEKQATTVAAPEAFPDTLAGQLQSAAKGSITAARKSGNAQAQPLYAATSNNPANKIPSPEWNALVSDDGVAAAIKSVKSDPYAGLQNAQEGSLQWLDQAKKHLDGKIEVAQRQGDTFAAKQMGEARDKILQAADASFPDYAKARGVIAQNRQNVVEPMEQGQVGKLSRSDDFRQQAATFLPENPLDVNANVVSRTAQTIGQQDPEIVRRVLAQHLRGTFNEANQSNVAGPNMFGGSKFAAKVAGNPQQEANLVAAVKASGVQHQPLVDALDVFRAQGMKPAVNSATAANLNESSLMGGSKMADLLMRPLTAIPGGVDNWRNGWATKGLAEALSAKGDSVKRIEELARANGSYSPTKQQMLINLLLANPESSATR